MKLLLAFFLIFLPLSAEAMTKQECIHQGYGCQWSKATGGKINGWYFSIARKEVMPPEGVSRKQTSRADIRPRPASLPAGAAGIKDSLIPVVNLSERLTMIDELIPPLYFGKLILAQALRGR